MAKGKKTGGRDIKPGQCINPAGRPKLGVIEELKMLTRKEIIAAMCECLRMPSFDLHLLCEDSTLTGESSGKVLFANLIKEGIKRGCPTRTNLILNYLIGRPKEQPEDDKPPTQDEILKQTISKIPSSILREVLRQKDRDAAATAVPAGRAT